MPDYTELTDAALAANKPVTQSTMRALRDNPLAVIEGASGAPRVSMKALDQQYFSARRTSDSFEAYPANADVLFGTEELDSGTLFNPANGRFTPTKHGIYLVNLKLFATSGSASLTRNLNLMKNGSAYRLEGVTSAGIVMVTFNTLIELNGSTDYIGVRFDGGAGGAGIYGGFFSAHTVAGL